MPYRCDVCRGTGVHVKYVFQKCRHCYDGKNTISDGLNLFLEDCSRCSGSGNKDVPPKLKAIECECCKGKGFLLNRWEL